MPILSRDFFQAFKFAVPMRRHPNCDFSYAGLKTSVRLAIEATCKQHAAAQALDAVSSQQGKVEEASEATGSSSEGESLRNRRVVHNRTALHQEAAVAALLRANASAQHSGRCDPAGGNTGVAAEEGEAAAALMQAKADIAASFQRTACAHLTDRVKRGISWAREMEPTITYG